MSEFLRKGDQILVKPQGLDYDLVAGETYTLKWNNREDYPYLVSTDSFKLPETIYELEGDTYFMKRTLTFHASNKSSTTGIMLIGTRGTGKTVLAKRIAVESKLPIIVVDSSYPFSQLTSFFRHITVETCVMFDEVEKDPRLWDTRYLLELLDGMTCTSKKLVLLTCNKRAELNENLFDRCSRIRYYRTYNANSNDQFIKKIAEAKGIEDINKVYKFMLDKIKIRSIDNINAFLDEVKMFGTDLTMQEILDNMNIFEKGSIGY